MATPEEEKFKAAAEARVGGKTGKELITEGVMSKEGRREMLTEGAFEAMKAAEDAPEEIMKIQDRAIAQSLAAAPGSDLRTLAGTTEEARAGAAQQVLEAQKGVGESKMAIAETLEAVGDVSEDLEEKDREMEGDMKRIIDDNKHWYGDDEVQMHKEIMEKVDALPDDPMYDDIRAKYQKKAHEIYNPETRKKSWDV